MKKLILKTSYAKGIVIPSTFTAEQVQELLCAQTVKEESHGWEASNDVVDISFVTIVEGV